MIYTSPWPEPQLPLSSVWDYVWSNPNKVPDSSTAVIDGPSGRSISRGQLRKDAQSIAYGLRNKLGLNPGQVVCVFSPNSFYYHKLVMALQCAGCVVSGANAAYTPSELGHQLSDSGSVAILCHPQNLEVALSATKALGWTAEHQRRQIVLAVPRAEAGSSASHFKSFDELIVPGQKLEPHAIAKDKVKSTVAYLGYSSGTSGKAKGVQTSHFNMTSVLSILTPFDVSHRDTQLLVLPLSHIYGLTKALHWPLVLGMPVVVLPKFELGEFCRLVEKHRVTMCLLVPPIALLLARDPIVSKYDVSSLRVVLSGAAPLGRELETELSKRIGTNVTQAYGMTETSPTTNYCPLATPRPGSIGPLLPHVRARICDPETGEDVKPGQAGEIILQGPNVMLGYLNRPDANAETLFEDENGRWLKTGDIAYVDKDGYFFITDRIKELIKYKGFQVAPAELESVLLECPLVSDACCIGLWNEEQATELPRAYVVLSAEGKKLPNGAEAVRKWVDGRVAAHKKLRGGVKVIDIIPKSPSGKLLRRVLRDESKKELLEGKVLAKL